MSQYRHAGANGEKYRLTNFWPRYKMGVSGQRHTTALLYPRTNWIGGWVGLRAGLV
jgi:hypothetical protein